MLEAAATALALAEAGAVTARWTLGPLLAREPYRPASDGDPAAFNRKREQAEATTVIDKARVELDTARRILAMFTVSCRALASFDGERDYFIHRHPSRIPPDRPRDRPRRPCLAGRSASLELEQPYSNPAESKE